jgi:hypothetical protein
MKSLNQKQKRELEKENGWNFIDEVLLTVEVPLEDKEKLEMGDEMIASMQTVENLETEKKAFDDKIKGQISDEEEMIRKKARELRRGAKDEEKLFPVFYDPEKDQRVFYDPETKKIVHTEEAGPADRQMKMA